jgi:nucleoid DNA-binding protein/DNA-directed RNA polymerase subunit RPC12/RpoP
MTGFFWRMQKMSATYLKNDLIAELAQTAGITKVKAETVINHLAQIAYREAKTGFTVPGICKLDVVRRKARQARIPSTGQRILVGEHDALRARPLKKAMHAVAPKMPGLVQYLTEEPAPDPSAPAATAPVTEGQPYNPEGLVSFRCGACGQEIEAPFDMAGAASECPACGGRIEVPYVSEPGTIWGRAAPETKLPAQPAFPAAPATGASPESAASAPRTEAQMGRTIRIELPDDV